MQPVDLHQRVEKAFNVGDVNALIELYEFDACMLGDDGAIARGVDAIRAVWAGFTALGGRISMTTRYAVEVNDLALLSNTWTFEIEGETAASSETAEVARRQPDGSCRYHRQPVCRNDRDRLTVTEVSGGVGGHTPRAAPP